MSFLTDWRTPCAAAELARLERPDFALEFLRRNPDYRTDHAATQMRIAAVPAEADAARAALARRWGLRFPGRSVPHLPREPRALARRTVGRRARPRARA